MVKKIIFKIVITFLIIGIVMITLFGLYTILELKKIQQTNDIGQITRQIAMTNVFVIIIFAVFASIIGVIAIKIIIAPISKILKSAEKIASGETTDVQYLTSEREEAEVGDLVKAFNLMTTELQENLNEASRQKKQIETILLHMTDRNYCFRHEW